MTDTGKHANINSTYQIVDSGSAQIDFQQTKTAAIGNPQIEFQHPRYSISATTNTISTSKVAGIGKHKIRISTYKMAEISRAQIKFQQTKPPTLVTTIKLQHTKWPTMATRKRIST